MIGILVITALTGPGIWNIKIFGYAIKVIVLLVCSVFALVQMLGYLRTIFTEGVGRNGSTVSEFDYYSFEIEI